MQCHLDSFDVSLPGGRMEANHMKTSHPSKLSASLLVVDDSPLIKTQFVAVGQGEGFYGHSVCISYILDILCEPCITILLAIISLG